MLCLGRDWFRCRDWILIRKDRIVLPLSSITPPIDRSLLWIFDHRPLPVTMHILNEFVNRIEALERSMCNERGSGVLQGRICKSAWTPSSLILIKENWDLHGVIYLQKHLRVAIYHDWTTWSNFTFPLSYLSHTATMISKTYSRRIDKRNRIPKTNSVLGVSHHPISTRKQRI